MRRILILAVLFSFTVVTAAEAACAAKASRTGIFARLRAHLHR